ncbi:hypothetical protein CEP54_015275 [Fusarium duplospermum]|uniref:Uncharacterized protein n=1 Tax=Fusarium duplospermum TaxID=1325734 RepID=A0A428NQA6_9HYPO|nr:hypothetical protein CEP54_015275 [Fusarium duplospermum]
MKFQTTALLFFLPAVLGQWNCNLPVGTGDYGTCVEDGRAGSALPCTNDHPCNIQGNGCVNVGAGTAHCS